MAVYQYVQNKVNSNRLSILETFEIPLIGIISLVNLALLYYYCSEFRCVLPWLPDGSMVDAQGENTQAGRQDRVVHTKPPDHIVT
jgi:hypothetical protein